MQPGGGGPITDDMLVQLARQRLARQIGGNDQSPSPMVTNNVYGALGGGGTGAMPPALGGGSPPGGGMAPGGDPFAGEPRDYMVDIVRQNYPEDTEAELQDPGDPSNVQRVAMPHGGWVKRVHRWTRPQKKKMVPAPPEGL